MRTAIYFTVYDWMASKFNLRGSMLLCYAMVYSYRTHERTYTTEAEVSDFLGVCRRQSREMLLKLFKMDLLSRDETGGKYKYYINEEKFKNEFYGK